jgi:hypothetical protein
MAGAARSKPEFCENEPVATPNQLKYLDLGANAFRGKPSKTFKTGSDSRNRS